MRRQTEKTYRLTASDLRILHEIKKHGFRTYQELRASVLQSYTGNWSWDKMNRLTKLDYIVANRGTSGAISGWTLAKNEKVRSLNLLQSTKFDNSKAPKYSSKYDHDIDVRFALDEFEKLPICKKIETESRLRANLFSKMVGYSKRELNEMNSYLPDGAVTLELAGKLYRIAIEIELNPKTTLRLRKKIENYVIKKEYDFVFYICKGDYVFQGALKNYQHVLDKSPLVRISKSKTPIYFSHLSDLKSDFINAKFSKPNDEFILKDFVK